MFDTQSCLPIFSDNKQSQKRGRKRLKTRSSRNTERESTDLSPSEEAKNNSIGSIKRAESATSSSLSTKEPYDTINRQRNKVDVIESNQFASLHSNLTDSTRQEKSNLPPSRTASLNSSSNSCSNSKRKAVAIVRPQPQQHKQDPSQVDGRKLSNDDGQIDLQAKLDRENLESTLNEKLISKGETKIIGKELKKPFSRSKIKSLSPKGELRKLQKEREDRFSLYDFPSDSDETESDSSPSSLSSLVKEESTSSTNVIIKNNPEKSKLSQTELRAASNNNSSVDCLLANQNNKVIKSSSAQSPPITPARPNSKTPTELTLEQPIHKGISTLPSSHGGSSLSRLPITTIARSYSSFDTKTTTSSASTNANDYSLLSTKDSRHKSRLSSGIGNVQGVADSLIGSHNKDAKSRKNTPKDNTFPTKTPTTVNSSNYTSSGTPISSIESLRMQTDTNTVSASSNYHPSHLTNQSHHQGDHNAPSASYVNLRDDRSDSGLSTLRSDGARSSGDERSGSRSSAVSDEILLRTAGGGAGVPSQASHSGRPNSANALDHTRLPNHTPPTAVTSLNPPFGSISSSSRPLHPPSSAASPTWKEQSTYNKHLPGQLPASISKTSKLSTLPPMSSETRPPLPSSASRGGTSGALGHTNQNLHHIQSSVPAVGAPPPAASSSITSQQQAAVAAAMSAAQQQQWASVAAAHQYQAALQAASLVASQQPSQVAQQAILNQYQSLAAASAAGITPEVLKQFPHLATSLPHHLLPGRGSAASTASAAVAHHDILIAREREMAERERAHR